MQSNCLEIVYNDLSSYFLSHSHFENIIKFFIRSKLLTLYHTNVV